MLFEEKMIFYFYKLNLIDLEKNYNTVSAIRLNKVNKVLKMIMKQDIIELLFYLTICLPFEKISTLIRLYLLNMKIFLIIFYSRLQKDSEIQNCAEYYV